jgi:hypothetical protein
MYHTVAVQHVKEWTVVEYLQNIVIVRERKGGKKTVP